MKNLPWRLSRWVLRLQQFDFIVVFKSGKKHLDADALSRCPLSTSSSASFTEPRQPRLPLAPINHTSVDALTDLQSIQRADTFYRTLIDRLNGSARPPNSRLRRQPNNYRLIDGVLCHMNRHATGYKWVPVIPRELRLGVLKALHDDATAGHLGFEKTYDRVRSRFFWPGLFASVAKYVASYAPRQHRKRSTSPPAGLLHRVPCPSVPFETMDIDLYGPLPPTSNGCRWIVTAVYHLTRYAETVPLPPACAHEVADFTLRNIILRHGAPRVLLSDRGKTFLSQVLAEVLRAANTIHRTCSSYHPQTNGLAERFHRSLSDMLSM